MNEKSYAALAARIKNGSYDEEKLFWIAAYIKDDLKGSQIEKVNRRAMITAYKARFHLDLTPGQLAGLYNRYGTPLKGKSPQAAFVNAMDAYREQKRKEKKKPRKPPKAPKAPKRIQAVPPPPPAPKPKPEPPELAPAPTPRSFVPVTRTLQDPAATEAPKSITVGEEAVIAVALGAWHPDRVKGSPFGYASITLNGVRLGRPLVTADDLRAYVIGDAGNPRKAVEAFLKGVPAFAEAHAGKATEVAERVAAYKPPKRGR